MVAVEEDEEEGEQEDEEETDWHKSNNPHLTGGEKPYIEYLGLFLPKCFMFLLVGGFNPFEKILVKLDHLPQIGPGFKQKNVWNHLFSSWKGSMPQLPLVLVYIVAPYISTELGSGDSPSTFTTV